MYEGSKLGDLCERDSGGQAGEENWGACEQGNVGIMR